MHGQYIHFKATEWKTYGVRKTSIIKMQNSILFWHHTEHPAKEYKKRTGVKILQGHDHWELHRWTCGLNNRINHLERRSEARLPMQMISYKTKGKWSLGKPSRKTKEKMDWYYWPQQVIHLIQDGSRILLLFIIIFLKHGILLHTS